MANNPTMSMIAREANVSRTAVYAVLNAPSKTNVGVSDEKRQHIMDAAARLGYVRNATAQSLKTGKYNSIAVLAQSIANAQFYRFFNTFDRLVSAAGYFTFLTTSEFDFEQERRKLSSILEQGVDALVVGLLHQDRNGDILQKYYQRNIPVIILGNVLGRNQDAMLAGFDEAAGARKIAEYLYNLDFSRIAYFKLLNDPRFKGSMFDARANYFTAACTQIMPDADLKIFSADNGGADLDGEVMVDAMLKKCGRGHLPQAVVCSNDLLAVNTVIALRRHGIKVPEDISVIGYDNLNEANPSMLPVTTLDLPYEKLAGRCWDLLLPRLNDRDDAERHDPVLVAPHLIVRQTSMKPENKHVLLNAVI